MPSTDRQRHIFCTIAVTHARFVTHDKEGCHRYCQAEREHAKSPTRPTKNRARKIKGFRKHIKYATKTEPRAQYWTAAKSFLRQAIANALPFLVALRAEEMARASAQKAIDDAETRARLAREAHEKSAKELDEQLTKAKVGTKTCTTDDEHCRFPFRRIQL